MTDFKKISLVPYDFNWPKQYEIESQFIEKCLTSNLINVYHIGSTAIPNLLSKPKIDILAVVKMWSIIDKPTCRK